MFGELVEWMLNLDPEFAFLLALPFAVGLAGFLSEAVRDRRTRHGPHQPESAGKVSHETHVFSR